LTVENYVKAIFNISEGGLHSAATGQVAAALKVSPGTVTSMLKTLSESGLANYEPYEGASLTEAGCNLALQILRRHRLIESFLTKSLNLDWDEVHNDAEQLEHAMSDFLLERIDENLGHPRFDPHGDPIPTAEGAVAKLDARPLTDCQIGDQFRLARVIDQSPEFLRFLKRSGLSLGVRGQVLDKLAEAGTVTIQANGRQTTLGRSAATSLLVTEPEENGRH
jgi:DtxR family Mn-dependent transcriptional regulator